MATQAPLEISVELLNASDLAKMLRVSIGTIRRMTDAGSLPGVIRLNRSVRFKRDIVQKWIDSGCGSLSQPTARRSGNK
jgi:excisionase family DNA binding protein